MKLHSLYQIAILSAVTQVLSMPTTSPSINAGISNVGGSLGDGLYHVSHAGETPSLISFTPIADLQPNITAALQKRAAHDPMPLKKRATATCTDWTLNADDTLNAQQCLRNAADEVETWDGDHWAFCKIGGTMAFACAYLNQYTCGKIINTMELGIDGACGWPMAGYVSDDSDAVTGTIALAVGRTFAGDHFCTGSFVGW